MNDQLDGIKNKTLTFFDENKRPDQFGRRSFFLEWDDLHAFILPGQVQNKDGSVHRAQAFFANPEKYIAQGYLIKGVKQQ